MNQTLARVEFPAMGTEVELISPRDFPQETVVAVRTWFEYVEERLSRFRPLSELSLLNGCDGVPFMASPLLVEVLRGALDAAGQNDGLFDPTVLQNMLASGYRRSFSEMPDEVEAEVGTVSPGWGAVDITEDNVITLPRGVGVDLGGYAKGWTVDRAASLLAAREPWLLSAGGDLLARGHGPDGHGWLVGIEDPFARGSDRVVINVHDCAVATSTTTRRQWRTTDGRIAHHLIDPRTGQPSESDLASVTVVAESVAEAEVQAKVLLILGRRDALIKANREDTAAVFIDNWGELTVIGSGNAFRVA